MFGTYTTNGKTILVVEDEKPVRGAIVEKFTHEGFTVLEAKDGEAGLEMALAKHPDILLVDIILPKMDGLSMCKKIREDAWGRKVPIVILTNLSDPEKIDEAMKNDVFDFLVKVDWKIEDVVKLVRTKLGVA